MTRKEKSFTIQNATEGGFDVTISAGGAGATVAVAPGTSASVAYDGENVVLAENIPSFPELVIRMREAAQKLDDSGCGWTHDRGSVNGAPPDSPDCDCTGLEEDSCEHGKTAAREMRRVADRIHVAALSLVISTPPDIAGARKMLEEAEEIEREFGDEPVAGELLRELDAAEMFESSARGRSGRHTKSEEGELKIDTFIVVCRADRKPDGSKGRYELATRRTWTDEREAQIYADGISDSREAFVVAGSWGELREERANEIGKRL